MSENRFYICAHCGNIIGMIHNVGVPVYCCGEKMQALAPNSTDASGEKHVPVVTVGDGKVHVNVGSVSHPMSEEHNIQWIYLETDRGGHRISLLPDQPPEVTFVLSDEKPVAVYAYCNLHGLWVSRI